jgi:hypothetical protein
METNQSNSLKWLDSWSVMSTVNEWEFGKRKGGRRQN